MVVGFPGVGAEISREQTATGSDHITANMDWSKEDCKILPQLAHAAKDAKLPGGFPNFEGLDKRVDDCSGNWTRDQAIDLYNTMTSVQPQYKDYSPDAGASLSSQLNAGKALAPSDFHRMQAISEFSDYPGAAMLRTKELNGETLTPGEQNALIGATEFPTNAFAAGLSSRDRAGIATPAERQLLQQYRKQHKGFHGTQTMMASQDSDQASA